MKLLMIMTMYISESKIQVLKLVYEIPYLDNKILGRKKSVD